MAEISINKMLGAVGNAALEIAKEAGIDIPLKDLYKEENLKVLAMVAGILRETIEKTVDKKIEVV